MSEAIAGGLREARENTTPTKLEEWAASKFAPAYRQRAEAGAGR